jgi:hypothetical protein
VGILNEQQMHTFSKAVFVGMFFLTVILVIQLDEIVNAINVLIDFGNSTIDFIFNKMEELYAKISVND